MVNFVETATLKVKDDSTAKIRKLNAEILRLYRNTQKMQGTSIAGRLMPPVNANTARSIQSLTRVTQDLTRANTTASKAMQTNMAMLTGTSNSRASAIAKMNRELTRLVQTETKAARIAARPAGAVPVGLSGGLGGSGGGSSRSSGYGGSGFRSIYAPFPQNVPSVFNLMAGYSAFNAAHRTISTGAQAIGAQAREQTTQRLLGFTEQQIAQLGQTAERASDGLLGITKTSSQATMRNLKMAGVQDQNLEAISRIALITKAGLTEARGAAQADRDFERIIKSIDLAGAFDQPERADSLFRGLTGATIAAGRDLDFNTVQRALVVSGRAMTLNAEAIAEFTTVVEEMGRPAGSRLQRANQVFNATTGVSGKIISAVSNAGLRTAGGGAVDRELWDADPFEWMRKHLTPILTKIGVDTENASQVNKALTGIIKDRMTVELATAAIVKNNERQRARQNAANVQFDKQRERANKDITAAAMHVKSSFENLSASLTPAANSIAPILVGFGDMLNKMNGPAALIAAGAGTAIGAAVQHPGAALMLLAGKRMGTASNKMLTAATLINRRSIAGNLSLGAPRGGPRGGFGVIGPWGGSGGSRSGMMMKGAGVAGLVGAGLTAYDLLSQHQQGNLSANVLMGQAASVGGMIAGGFIGSAFGPVGTVIGATAGSALAQAVTERKGLFEGLFSSSNEKDYFGGQSKSSIAGGIALPNGESVHSRIGALRERKKEIEKEIAEIKDTRGMYSSEQYTALLVKQTQHLMQVTQAIEEETKAQNRAYEAIMKAIQTPGDALIPSLRPDSQAMPDAGFRPMSREGSYHDTAISESWSPDEVDEVSDRATKRIIDSLSGGAELLISSGGTVEAKIGTAGSGLLQKIIEGIISGADEAGRKIAAQIGSATVKVNYNSTPAVDVGKTVPE